MSVQIILFAGMFVDRDAFEDQIVVEMRINRRRFEDRVDHAVFRHAVLDDVDLDVDPSCHLDGSAEGDFAVTLAEMDIAHRETAALHIDGEIDLRAARQVLDVAISAMFSRRHGAPCLLGGVLGG